MSVDKLDMRKRKELNYYKNEGRILEEIQRGISIVDKLQIEKIDIRRMVKIK